MIISLVVPVVNPALHIDKLFQSIAVTFSTCSIVELVLVNQSGTSILDAASLISKISVVEILTDKLISSAEARNLGASKANGDFLFFLDDDAVIHASNFDATKLLKKLSNLDALICQRGEMKDGVYYTHWKQKKASINQFNFASFIIEWNVIELCSTNASKANIIDIGKSFNTNSGQNWHIDFFKGNMGVFKLYNRVLTSNEVLQNYNSYKNKYGI